MGAGQKLRVRVWWAVLALGVGSTAHADESPYCQKVRARAGSDAALLMWPRLVVDGIHIPAGGALEIGVTTGSGYQLRAGLAYSPLDLYRGIRVMRVGEADCVRHNALQAVATILAQSGNRERLAALRRQEQYLSAHRGEWRAFSAQAEQRLKAGVITITDFHMFRRHVMALEHKLVSVLGEIGQIEASNAQAPLGTLRKSTREWLDADARVEREASHVRALDAWQVKLTGGVVPQSRADWFGMVEVSFNFGAFGRHRQETRYLQARADEAQHADYEFQARARVLVAQLRAAKTQAEQGREVIVRELAFLGRARGALEGSEAKHVLHARDTLAVEQIALEAERIFLDAFAGALAPVLEDQHER